MQIDLITTAVCDPNDRTDRRVLETAAKLGVKQYRMKWFRREKNQSPAERVLACRSVIAELSHLNKDLNIIGSYQNHAGEQFVGASIWELWLMLQHADQNHMGVQYDVRHAVVESGLAWRSALDLIYPFIKSVVLKDFTWAVKGGAAVIENVPLGRGVTPYRAFIDKLASLRLAAPISLHAPYNLGSNISRHLTRDLKTARGMLAL